MAMRALGFRSVRGFSGGDSFWLHLHSEPDKYPQYAHLHWHTVDPLEIGKYAELRSKNAFGDHVANEPGKVEWFPDSKYATKMTLGMRNTLYQMYMDHAPKFTMFLEEMPDYEGHPEHTLMDVSRDTILEVVKPAQLQEATKMGQELIKQYKEAGVKFTRESISDKTAAYLMDSLTMEQVKDLDHGMIDIYELYGAGRPMTED